MKAPTEQSPPAPLSEFDMTGTVYLIGAGPGATDLLTLRAARLLEAADIVFHDALVEPETLAIARNAKLVAVGKRCGAHSASQAFINKQLVDAAKRYRTVVRLKGGDPMLFGRAQEELDALMHACIQAVVVPGVTAASAASADLSQSLTQRGVSRSVVFLTPKTGVGEPVNEWARAAANADTAVLYMAAKQAEDVVLALTLAGVPAHRPVVIVENASKSDRRIIATTVNDLVAATSKLGDGPALVLVGDVYQAILEQVDSAVALDPVREARIAA